MKPLICASIFILACSLYSLAIDLPFFTHGESREALVITAMSEQDQLILPLRNGVDIPSKPPLFHWTARALTMLGGIQNEAMYRLPSVLCAALTLVVLYTVVARRMQGGSALVAVTVLGTSVDFFRTAGVARVDIMFTFWVSSATWVLFHYASHRLTRGSDSWKLLSLSIVPLVGAGLTKGPAGLILPWAVTGIFLLLKSPRNLPVVGPLFSCGCAALFCGLWYAAAYRIGGSAFLDVQIVKENLARLTGAPRYHLGHESGPLELVVMLLIGLLPWSLYFPLLFTAAVKFRRAVWRSVDPAVPFCVVWVVFYLLFFSFTASKRGVYLLPSFPAWAYLFAAAFERRQWEAEPLRKALPITQGLMLLLLPAYLGFIALVADARLTDITGVLSRFKVKPHDIETIDALTHGSPVLVLFACASFLGFAYAVLIFRRSLARSIAGTAAGALLVGLAVSLGAIPVVAQRQSPQTFLESVPEIAERKLPVYQFHEDYHTVNYYLRRNARRIDARNEMTAGTPAVIVSSEKFVDNARVEFPTARVIAVSPSRVLDGKFRLYVLLVPQEL